MPLKFFAVPAAMSAEAEAELNGFLAGHKVVSIDRRLVRVVRGPSGGSGG